MVKVVALNQIEPGMVLKKPVKNNFGQILLGDNTVLTATHILALKTWNIPSVFVESEDDVQGEEFSEELIKAAYAKLLERFNWAPRNENERDLVRLGVVGLLASKFYEEIH